MTIPPQARDSAIAEALEDARRVLGTLGRAEAFVRDELDVPSHYRPARAIRPHSGGGVWVQLAPSLNREEQTWVLHDAQGEPTALVRFPAGLQLAVIDASMIWAINHDDLGIPYLVRFRIAQPR